MMQHLVSSPSVSGRPLHKSRQSSVSTCASDGHLLRLTIDDTRCCINTIHPPDDEHKILETCRDKADPVQAWSGPEDSRKLMYRIIINVL